MTGGLQVAEALAEPVEGDGHDHDGDADLHAGTDMEARHAEEQILAEAGGAHERGDDDHGEALHHHLVDTHQHGAAGRRQLDLPEHLPWSAAGHDAGLDDLLGNALDAQNGEARHRGHGVGDGGNDASLVREANEHADRDHEREVRHRLGEVQQRVEELLDPAALRGEHAQHAADGCGDRDADENRRKRDHRLVPPGLGARLQGRLADEGGVDDEPDGQQGQPPSTQLPAGDAEESGDHDPGEGRDVPRLVEADERIPGDAEGDDRPAATTPLPSREGAAADHASEQDRPGEDTEVQPLAVAEPGEVAELVGVAANE